MTREFDAVHGRHTDVNQRNVAWPLLHEFQCTVAIISFGDYRGGNLSRYIAEQIAQPGTRRRFVVNQQQA
jgi:hypothetical protein